MRIAQTLFRHIWPIDSEDERVKKNKRRVLGSIGLMVAGKAVTINVPFVFKNLVDSLPSPDQLAVMVDPTLSVVSLAMILGYGVSRASASGLQELRNAVFAHVAQDAIRRVGRNVFDHVHKMDLQFHLSRNTGQLSRVLDRGNRSISFTLNALTFNVVPTALEITVVTGILGYNFGMAQ